MSEQWNIIIEKIIDTCYNARDRHYHNYSHIQDMLNTFDGLFKSNPELTNKIFNYHLFREAIRFHDILQGPNAEENSALLADVLLRDIYDEIPRSYIKELILATRYDMPCPDRFDCKLIRDLDLKGLGADHTTYVLNGFKIRREFNGFSEKAFNEGRIKFLEMMLAMPVIYETEYFEYLEGRAHENMQNELKQLKG